VRRPRALWEVLIALLRRPMPSLFNAAENALGFAFGLAHARHFERSRPDLLHAVWATAPAAAALLLEKLIGVRFSMGAHAYDVFRHAGDWLLREKIESARLIHTTSESTLRRLLECGADPERTVLIRRGLLAFPAFRPRRTDRKSLRLLSVGRLVEKKGHLPQLQIYRRLKDAGVSFQARIVGDGPLRAQVEERLDALDLRQEVALLGRRSYEEVLEHYAWADAFLFTGIIARSGDRDGLPNVIPEAMAAGVPVVTAPVAGAMEAVRHGETGLVCRVDDPDAWVTALRALAVDHALSERLRRKAREWAEEHFDAHRNAARLLGALRDAGLANA
jgi:glycosyltransferase involved in cell wall biosynthesis